MKKTTAILGCAALLASACSDNPPVKDPSTGTSSTSSAGMSSNAGAPASSPAMPNGMSGDTMSSPTPTSTPAPASDDAMGSRSASMANAPKPGAADPAPAPVAGAPDNTRKNERDRKGATLTAGDQGNGGSEVKITAAIRKQVVASSMSFDAKNTKIITTGTKVTLRGPVKTDAEKAQIESIAKGTPGVTDVDNQLEVKK